MITIWESLTISVKDYQPRFQKWRKYPCQRVGFEMNYFVGENLICNKVDIYLFRRTPPHTYTPKRTKQKKKHPPPQKIGQNGGGGSKKRFSYWRGMKFIHVIEYLHKKIVFLIFLPPHEFTQLSTIPLYVPQWRLFCILYRCQTDSVVWIWDSHPSSTKLVVWLTVYWE